MIKTYNPLTRKTNFFRSFDSLRSTSQRAFWEEVAELWCKDYRYTVQGIVLAEDHEQEKKIRKAINNLSARLGAKYLASTTTEDDYRKCKVCIWTNRPKAVLRKLKKYDFTTVTDKVKKIRDGLKDLVKSFITPDSRFSHSRPPASTALASVLCYTRSVGVGVKEIVSGQATVGWVANKKATFAGKDADKLPKALRKDTIYVYVAKFDKVFFIPRAVKQAVIPDSEVKDERPMQNEKPDLILYSGGAGTGKTTQMLLDLATYKGKKWVTSWTGAQTERLREKCKLLKLLRDDLTVETVHSFLRAIPKEEDETDFMRHLMAQNGLDDEVNKAEELTLAIDEISLLPPDLIKEIARLRSVVKFNILATGDYSGQLKNHSYSFLKQYFNIATIRFVTCHRPKPQKVTLGQITKRQIFKALREGQTIIYQNRTVRRWLEKALKRARLRLCIRNCLKIDLTRSQEELENPDVVNVTTRIFNGQLLKRLKKGLYKTPKGEVVALSSKEEQEILDVPAISVQKAQGMETEKVLFVVEPMARIASKALHVVLTRAIKLVQTAVISLADGMAPPLTA